MRSFAPDASGGVIRELDWRPPEQAFGQLCRQKYPIWLDSAGPAGPRSRYSFLCVDPWSVLEQRNGELTRDGRRIVAGGFEALGSMVRDSLRVDWSGPVPFLGGAVGVLGYGLAAELERLPAQHPVEPDLPSLWIGLYDLLLAFDRIKQRCWLISTGLKPGADGVVRANWLRELLAGPIPPTPPAPPRLRFVADRSADGYRRMVREGLDRIKAGDIFQANLTTRYVAERPEGFDPVAAYNALRAASPAAFGAFIGWQDGTALASVSPERFLRLDARGNVETRPVKGTAPRRSDPLDDAAALQALAASEKDRAENLMIVDLMRNDLARVAKTGSVSVPVLFEIDSIPALHHLVSTVTARLRDGEDAVSLLRASFPGGSITGAPKIRAMEIIDELEASARGLYCGSVVWIGHDGAMDSSILIRSLFVGRRQLFAHAGGGVVADSDPAAEHAEMLAKLESVVGAFR